MVMGRYCKLASLCAAFLLILSLPALAGSVNSFSNVKLQGVSGTVSGSFTFDSTTDQFSNCSLSFTGSAFNGVNVNDPNSVKGTYVPGQGWLFVWGTNDKSGDTIWYSILLNPATNQYWTAGWIANWQQHGNFNYSQVPEGGAELTYLLLSAMAVFCGILMSGKQRRAIPTAPSI
jgi:hypothetical protein